jgi:hypothetical protein
MSKRSQAWKALEREAAKTLVGKRVSRGADFSESAPDVDHEVFSIECKYRSVGFTELYDYLKQAASYSEDKLPVAIIRQKGKKALAVMDLETLGVLYIALCNSLAAAKDLTK